MRWVFRWLGRLALVVALLIAGLVSPLLYIETMCRPTGSTPAYTALLPKEWRRAEGRTLLTYPEWHIVHAYEDYAAVIRTGDPQDFDFLPSIAGFWTSLCAVSQASGSHGGFDWETKQTAYTIGISFTAELLAKAAYEETMGRAASWIRGPDRAALDDLSAQQAADYAGFLQQVPWYKWDFRRDATALDAAATPAFRDQERRLALGIEFRGKAAYAGVIDAAVASVGTDALRLRSIVRGLTPEALDALADVSVIAVRPQGIEIETPRYRAFTHLAETIATANGDFVEIAGNDDIMFTAISDQPQMAGAIHDFARQGNPGYRHLVLVPVAGLAGALRALPTGALEQIHDY